jgi:hypothetical protein
MDLSMLLEGAQVRRYRKDEVLLQEDVDSLLELKVPAN